MEKQTLSIEEMDEPKIKLVSLTIWGYKSGEDFVSPLFRTREEADAFRGPFVTDKEWKAGYVPERYD